MVKDHSDSKRGNPLPPHGLLFPIDSRVLLYAPSHRQDITYQGLCYTSRGALAGTRKDLYDFIMSYCHYKSARKFLKILNETELRESRVIKSKTTEKSI